MSTTTPDARERIQKFLERWESRRKEGSDSAIVMGDGTLRASDLRAILTASEPINAPKEKESIEVYNARQRALSMEAKNKVALGQLTHEGAVEWMEQQLHPERYAHASETQACSECGDTKEPRPCGAANCPFDKSASTFDVVAEFHRLVVREWEKAYQRPMVVALPNDPEKTALVELEKLIRAQSSAKRAINQCDGCRRTDLRLRENGIHYDKLGHAVMGCSKDRYESNRARVVEECAEVALRELQSGMSIPTTVEAIRALADRTGP